MAQKQANSPVPPQVLALLGDGPVVALAGGRTNRLWRSGARVAKLFTHGTATPLFGNDPGVEWIALNALGPRGLAPVPLGLYQTDAGACLVYSHVAGQAGQTAPGTAARLLHRLHSYGPIDGFPTVATGAAVLAEGQRMFAEAGVQPSPMPAAPLPPDRPVPIHRDPVAQNIIACQAGAVLVDWQCPGMGDPVEDLAHFLSPAMQVLYGTTGPAADFLSVYPDQTVVARYRIAGAAFHWRMAGYCAWQVARGVQDYRSALEAEMTLLDAWPYT